MKRTIRLTDNPFSAAAMVGSPCMVGDAPGIIVSVHGCDVVVDVRDAWFCVQERTNGAMVAEASLTTSTLDAMQETPKGNPVEASTQPEGLAAVAGSVARSRKGNKE